MTLPPGFRFHPTDEELVSYYLIQRVKGVAIEFDVIADVDLYKCEPWDLPSKSRLPSSDLEWFFFSPRDRKYPNGARTNRATEAGYWKATGRDRFVKTANRTIGMKKTLVFYLGRAPHGERTDWLMHEYRLDGEERESSSGSQDAYVLCRVFKKNGFGPGKNPRNGLDENVDNADSPSDDTNPAFLEYEMKPSLDLPPLQQSGVATNQQPPMAIALGESLAALPVTAAPLPSNVDSWGGGGGGDFAIDENFHLSQMDGSFESIMGFSFLEDMPDLIVPSQELTTPDSRNELSKGWQQYADPSSGMTNDVFPDSLSLRYVKYDDPPASKFAMQPMAGVDSFDLDLPPLKESPSPPSEYLPSMSDETSGVVDSPFQPQQTTTIQIRPRPKPQGRSPLPYTAQHRIRCIRSSRTPVKKVAKQEVVEEDVKQEAVDKDVKQEVVEKGLKQEVLEKDVKQEVLESEVTDGEQTFADLEQSSAEFKETPNAVEREVSLEEELKPDKTAEDVDESRQVVANASSDILVSERGKLGTEKLDNTLSETSAPSTVTSPFKTVLLPSSSLLTTINRQVVESDERLLMKQSVLEVQNQKSVSVLDDQKSVTGVFHLKGYGELAPGIGSIHVNAVTISCSCDKVSTKPHIQATVCDCYNSAKLAKGPVLQEAVGKREEEVLKDGQIQGKRNGGFRKGFTCVFLMGVMSAFAGFFAFNGVWRATRQILRQGVQFVSAAGDM